MSDPINPDYYKRGNIEVVDFIKDQGLGYTLGNAVKYICRAGFKPGETRADAIRKAIRNLTLELGDSVEDTVQEVDGTDLSQAEVHTVYYNGRHRDVIVLKFISELHPRNMEVIELVGGHQGPTFKYFNRQKFMQDNPDFGIPAAA